MNYELVEAAYLKALRTSAKLSQAELACRAGLRREKLCYAEAGRIFLNGEELSRIRQVVAQEGEKVRSAVSAALGTALPAIAEIAHAE
jgi:transcriptional regulator with XRE-family HTH domain